MLQEKRIIDKISSYRLPNGFKTVFAPNEAHPVVSLQLFVRIGSCWEEKDTAGYSHMMEHLVFKSTAKYPSNQLTMRASYLGSNINAYTEFDSTCFYLTLSSRFGKEGLELLCELVRHADFSAREFTEEKGVVLEELNQYQNDPEDFFLEQIPGLYFIESPFKVPIIGTKESLLKATPQKLRSFYRKHYTPNNCFLVVSGDFEKKRMLEDVECFFSDWGAETETVDSSVTGRSSETKKLSEHIKNKMPQQMQLQSRKTLYPKSFTVKSISKGVAKPMLAFVVPELSDQKSDSYSLGLVTRIFAVGKKSRLYRRLFVKEKIIEQIRVESFTGIYDGISIILIIPKQSSFIERIIDVFLEEFEQLRHFGFSIDEFNETKTELMHSHRYSFEYMHYLAMSLGLEELLGSYKHFIDYPEIMKTVTENSVYRVTKDYYTFDKLGIFHLGNSFPTENILSKIRFLRKKRIENGAAKGDFYETEITKGLKVLFKRVSGRPTIGITAAFRVSQLNENSENRGINLLTSIMLLYGNENSSYEKLLEFCSRHGIQIDISAQEEVTLIKVKCFAEMFATSLQLAADIIQHPLFPAEHFHNIQKTLLSNLERMKDFPGFYASHLWRKQIFGRESNLLEREGTKTTLRKITRKRVVNWYHEHYKSQALTIAIVGDFDFKDALFICARIFKSSKKSLPAKGLSRNERSAFRRGGVSESISIPQTDSQQVSIINPQKRCKIDSLPDNQQAIIHIGGFGCSSQQTVDNTAFHLLAQVIGGDMNSRLFHELREKRGWAYSTGFDYISLQERGFFVANAMVDKQKGKQSHKIIIKILKDIMRKGVTEEELEIAKNTIRGARLRAEESVLAQATTLATLDVLGYSYDYYLQREERLQKITTEDLQRIAREYFAEDLLYSHFLE